MSHDDDRQDLQARRRERRDERLAHRETRRGDKRQEEIENASIVGGVVALAIALMFAVYALLNPHQWWLIFVAFGIGSGGAKQITMAQRRDRAALQDPSTAVSSLPLAAAAAPNEVDVLCDQLLADLRASPEAVRAFVITPERTIESLRETAHTLVQRRGQLANERALERIADVQRQRGDLILRRDAASDETARAKLNEAVGSIDGQVAALRQIAAAHERVDGEYTSLLVALQELRTRVALAKTAGAGVQLDGLRQSVSRLNSELEAITQALSTPAVAPVGSDDFIDPLQERIR